MRGNGENVIVSEIPPKPSKRSGVRVGRHVSAVVTQVTADGLEVDADVGLNREAVPCFVPAAHLSSSIHLTQTLLGKHFTFVSKARRNSPQSTDTTGKKL